jgi:lincosamide nucleotidyltransferase A/C/D/E
MMLSYDAAGAVAAPHGQCSSVGVMNAEAAADLLAAFRARGLRACVGGGWAVDALLDHQTGPHRDLDLAVDAAQLSEIMGFLAELGYSPAVDWLPVRVEVEDENGQRVDLHPLAFAEDGSAVQAGLGGTEFRYAADAFTTGKITGQPVDCLTAEQQLRFRQGYTWRGVDLHDVPLIRQMLRNGENGQP